MTHRMQCCCEGAPCDECSIATTCYDTSYVIPDIDILYTFSYQPSNVDPCNLCGQICGHIGYEIECRITAQNLVVTRRGGVSAPCCYFWRGDVDVEYTLTVSAVRRCVGTNCPRNWTQVFTGSRQVPACIDVTCLECTTWDACGKTYTESAWMHTLRICSFGVANVNVDGLNSVDSNGNPACYPWYTDCDPQAVEPCVDCTVARGLWCRGGAVTYISARDPLDAITTMHCWGWRTGQLCGEDCEVDNLWEPFPGPFSAYIGEELDAQGENTCDIPGGSVGSYARDFPTRSANPGWNAFLDVRCGSTDQEFIGFCFDHAFLQGTCSSQHWSYT
jgi:hypothetical protein